MNSTPNIFKGREAGKLKRKGFTKGKAYFHDESPKIGSGWRLIWYKEGRKWVYLISNSGRARLPVRVWNDIKTSLTH